MNWMIPSPTVTITKESLRTQQLPLVLTLGGTTMILNLKSYVTPSGKIVSLEDNSGRKYFQALDSDSQGSKVAKSWATRNGFIVIAKGK